MSTGSMPARTRARREAPIPRSDVSSSGSATWRCSMPVRSLIHSSVVSPSRGRSSFVMTRLGRYAPTPRITDLMIATLHLVPADGSASALSCLFLFRCLALGDLPVQRIEVGGQVCDQIAFCDVVADADGA